MSDFSASMGGRSVGGSANTVAHVFASAVRSRGQQPFITFYDDATGERVELSGATLGNWVAKTANLLIDGLGLQPGDTAAVRLPVHWQTAAIVLGCWTAGVAVDLHGSGDADVAFVTQVGPGLGAPTVLALSLAPLGMPFRPGPPVGTEDFVLEVRQYGDNLPAPLATPASLAVPGTTHAQLLVAAAALGNNRGMPTDGRVLIDGDLETDPALWLAAPLALGTSIVLCRNMDAKAVDERLAAERAVALPPT